MTMREKRGGGIRERKEAKVRKGMERQEKRKKREAKNKE